jgi:hypothetical protein
VRGVRSPRNGIAIFAGLHRVVAALAGLVALALYPSPAALPVFVGLHVLSWASLPPASVLWQGFMTDLVPLSVRGTYFSRRHVYSQVVGISSILVYGVVLDRLPGAPGFLVLSLCALIAALLNTGAWWLHPDLPPGEARTRLGFLQTVRLPLSRPGPHRTISFFLAAWAFAQGLAVPFYPVALVRMLGLSFGTVSLLVTLSAVAGMVFARAWGRNLDRVGEGPVLGLVTGMAAAVPVVLLAGRVVGLPAVVAAYLIFGVAAVGYGLAYQTLNMSLAPREDRGAFFAFFAAMGGTAGFLTPILAGPLSDRNLPALLVASAVLSATLSALWYFRIRRVLTAPGVPERGN